MSLRIVERFLCAPDFSELLGEEDRSRSGCRVGKGTDLNQLLFGNAFRVGSRAMWEKLASLFHSVSLFWIHFNAI